MLGTISKDQYAQMRQQLIVPLAIGDILFHDLPVEPDMQYGLHMALSEIDPDSALLAIALSARDIALKAKHRAPIAAALEKEAENILTEYGPTWLRNNLNAPIPSHIYADILDTVPEDLEALADLMDALEADLNEKDTPIVLLTHLLSIQARAHMEIADFVLAEIAYERQCSSKRPESLSFGYSEREEEEPVIKAKSSFAGDNIIIFPGSR